MTSADLLLVHGEEGWLVDRDTRAWLARARANSVTDLDVEIHEAPGKLDAVRRSLQEMPFLADQRFVLLRDPPQLTERSRRGADSADALVQALGMRSPQSAVCLSVRARVAAQNPVLALMRSEGRIVEHPRMRLRDQRLFTERQAADRGVQLPRGAVDHIIRYSGGDLGIIDGELAKLAAWAGGARRPTLDDVRALVAGGEQLQTWDVLDRVLAAPHAPGAAAVDALLADGAAALPLVSALARQLRELLVAHGSMAGSRGPSTLAADLGIQPWQAERLVRWVGVTTPALVEEWLRALQRLDARTRMGLADDSAMLRAIVLRAVGELASRSAARLPQRLG